MKKLLMIATLIGGLAAMTAFKTTTQSYQPKEISIQDDEFCEGWEDGYCEGWMDVKGELAYYLLCKRINEVKEQLTTLPEYQP